MAQSLISKHLSQPIGTIVHFGAGRCAELDFYKQAAPDKLILVEANPDLSARLERRTANMDGAEVIHAAITASNGQVALKVLSLPEASSLRVPTELIDLFPGIRINQEVMVDGRAPQDILKEVELDANKENWLIIDIPGEELAALNQLEESGYLATFERVVLRCGVSALYEDSAPADQSLSLLSACGYEVLELDRDEDPDRPEWLLKRNALKLENIELNERLTAMQDQIAALKKERVKQAKKLEARGKGLEEVKTAKAEAEKKAAGQIKALTQERDEQAREAKARSKGLEEVKTAQAEAEKKAADQIEALTQERDEQAREAEARDKELEALKTAQAEAEKKAAEQVEALTQERDEQAKQAEARGKEVEQLKTAEAQAKKKAAEQIEALTQERDEQAREAEARGKGLEEVKTAKAEAEKKAAEQIEALTKERDEQAKLNAELKEQMAALKKERDEQAREAEAHSKELEALKTAQTKADKKAAEQIKALTQERDEQAKLADQRQEELEKLKAERDEQTKLAADRQADLDKWVEKEDRLNQRQRMIDDEMVRAEAQIEFIKDILIREK